MGIFDSLFDSGLGQNGRENGVDVKYTGGTIKHLDSNSKYGYDAKISQPQGGNTGYFASNNDWISHSHDVSDKNGNYVYNRDANTNSSSHPWTDRNHILNIEELNSLSVYDLIDIYNDLCINCDDIPKVLRKTF